MDIPHMSPFQQQVLIHQHNKITAEKEKEMEKQKRKMQAKRSSGRRRR
ncbi:hypothetical protein ACTWP4_18630 [Gracilibacillus sp. D59]